jgi:hypothetical protein
MLELFQVGLPTITDTIMAGFQSNIKVPTKGVFLGRWRWFPRCLFGLLSFALHDDGACILSNDRVCGCEENNKMT